MNCSFGKQNSYRNIIGTRKLYQKPHEDSEKQSMRANDEENAS